MVSRKVRVDTENCRILYNHDPDFRDYGDASLFCTASQEIIQAMQKVLKGFAFIYKGKANQGEQVIEVQGPHAEDNCRCAAELIASRMRGRVVTDM